MPMLRRKAQRQHPLLLFESVWNTALPLVSSYRVEEAVTKQGFPGLELAQVPVVPRAAHAAFN